MKSNFVVIFCLLFMTCSHMKSTGKIPENTFSKIASYINNKDFVINNPETHFSKNEIEMIYNHRQKILDMIRHAISNDNSIGGAYLINLLKQKDFYPLLKEKILNPGTPYCWEGPDYTRIESFLTDDQYVYHSIYIDVIEQLLHKPIAQSLSLDTDQKNNIINISNDKDHENHYWALWMRRKLNI